MVSTMQVSGKTHYLFLINSYDPDNMFAYLAFDPK